MNESTKWLYEKLSSHGYNVGASAEIFDSLMVNNPESRKWAYNTAQKHGYNVGEYDMFERLVGAMTDGVETTESGSVVVSPAEAKENADSINQFMENRDTLYSGLRDYNTGIISGAEQRRIDSVASEMEAQAEAARQRLQEDGTIDRMKESRKEARREKLRAFGRMLGSTPQVSSFGVSTNVFDSTDEQLSDVGQALDAGTDYRQNKLLQEKLDVALDMARAGENQDGLRGVENFGLGLWDSATRLSTWDFGASDIVNSLTLQQIVEKWENDPSSLTATEQKVLDGIGMATAVQELYSDQVSIGYNVGQSLPESAGFMASMALNPASGLGKSLARNAVRTYGRNSIRKNLARIGGDIAETAIMTATTGAGRVAADALERINGSSTYEIGENGVIMYGGQKDQETVGNAVIKAIGANFIENYSEALGEYFNPLLGMSRKVAAGGLRKMNLNKWADALSDVQPSQMTASIRALREKAKFGGILGEIMEEEIGMALNTLFVGDNQWSDFVDLETQLTTVLSCAIMSGTLNGVEQVSNVAARRKMEKNAKNAEQSAANAFGEQFAELRESIDQASPEGMVDVLRDVYMNQGYSLEQKRKLAEYAAARLQMQYYNAADAKARREVNKTQQGVLDAYEAGRHAQLPTYYNIEQEYKNSEEAINASENAENIWAAIETLNRAPIEEHDMIINDFTEEEQQLIRQYRYNAARILGAVNSRAEQAEDLIDEYRGQIAPFTKPDGTVTTAILGDNVVFVMEQNENGDAVVHTNDGRKIFAKTRDLEHVEIHNAEDLIERFRQSTNEAMDIETENAFEHHPKTQAPQVGLQLQSPEGEVVITAVNDNMVEIVPAVYKDGQVQPKEGAEPRTITVDDAYAWQDDYYLSMDADQAYANAMAETNNMSAETAENEGTPTEQIEQSVSEEVTDGQIAETQPTETESVAPAAPQTARERVPKDDKGNPIYEQTDADTAWDAIVEETEGDVEMAQSVAEQMLANKKAALEKLQKGKAKAGANVAQIIANEKKRQEAISKAEADVKAWERISQVNAIRQQKTELERAAAEKAEAEQRKAEEARILAEQEEQARIEREQLNGVPDMVDDTPQDARARGFRRVNGHKVDRQEIAPSLQGKEVGVKFANDMISNGRVAVIEAETLQPSHLQGQRNPAHFIDEAQPKERNDEASVASARKIASNIRPEEITTSVTAYTGAPTVNMRGEAIQGNSRSDALRVMWAEHPDQAEKYKQYLIDHAEEFGLNAEEVAAMQHPVLVNMLDVSDADAINLGQYVAQDTESGGTERIKPKNMARKMGSDIRSYANILLRSSDEEASFSELVDKNGVEVLKWMNTKGYITPTQYASAFDSKGNMTAEAKNDLRGILYQSIFQGGNTQLEEQFNAMPAKAQKAILATAYRDYDSPESERMVSEIQSSIRAYYALSHDRAFVDAKNYAEAKEAMLVWSRQYQMDDVTGESFLPSENFSNFALELAVRYKGNTQSATQNLFNELFDLIQGTKEASLFEEADNRPRTLAEAIKETLNIDYNGQNGSNALVGDDTSSQEGRQGSAGDSTPGELPQNDESAADDRGRTSGDSNTRPEETGGVSEVEEPSDGYILDEGEKESIEKATISQLKNHQRTLQANLAIIDRIEKSGKMTEELVARRKRDIAWLKAVEDSLSRKEQIKAKNKWGVKSGNNPVPLDTVKKMFAEWNENADIQALFDRVVDTFEKLGINITFEDNIGSGKTQGWFAIGENRVKLPTHMIYSNRLSNQSKASTMLHEMIHGVTQYVLYVAKLSEDSRRKLGISLSEGMITAAKQLNEIYDIIKKDKRFEGQYGLKDVHEMVSELAEPEFRALLKATTIWGRIVEAIRNILGLNVENNALDGVSKALDYIIDNYDADQYRKVSAKARRKATANVFDMAEDVLAERELQAKPVLRGESEDNLRFRDGDNQDAAYMDAVERGDMETAQRMVDEAARKAMKKTKVVDKDKQPMLMSHHTDAEGFYVFDRGKIGTGQGQAFLGAGFNFSRGSGSSVYGSRNIQAYLDARKPLRSDRNTLSIYQIEQIIKELNAISGDNIEYNFADNISRAARAISEYGGDLDTYASLCTAYSGETRDVLEVFEKLGFDSTIEYGDDKRIMNVVVFNSHQIKSADPVTYDDNGNVIPLSRRFNLKEEDIRFRDGAPFFSNAERAVENIKQNKATPEQWLAMIKKDGGLKAGEDKWMGLSDWLNEQKAQGVKTLTKDEVLAFIRENQIEIEEVEYGDLGDTRLEELQAEFDELVTLGEEETGSIYTSDWADWAFEAMVERYGDDFREAFRVEQGYNTFPRLEAEEDYDGNMSDAAKYFLGANPINSTRLDYTTEGLDNKKEIALVVPTIESWNQSDEVHFGDAGEGRAVAWVRFGETTDKDGKRVLVIDEVQSKRHDEGRAKGYKQDVSSRTEAYRKFQDIESSLANKYGDEFYNLESDEEIKDFVGEEDFEVYASIRDEYIEARRFARENNSRVPDAPFDKNYHELVMKRMLRYAAENGFDKVAWTKGAQQAERYNLAKRYDYFERKDNPNEEGRRFVFASHANADVFRVNDEGVVIGASIEEAKGKTLASVVGSELAEQMMSLENGDIIDKKDIVVGGEGMKGFYDEMIPRFMNKYTKKWGAKVGEVTLPNVEEAGRTMWSVDVTPEMRESVMQGQPMFREGMGAITDREVSYENDPIAKFMGKPRYYGKRAAAFAERERKRMENAAKEAAEMLGIEAEIITDASTLQGRKAKAKGWYDIVNKKVVVVVPNHVSMGDAVRTVLHEGIAHHGLRELFGDGFDAMLDNVYNNVSPELKARIDAIAERTGVSTGVATEEYMASLAETTNFEEAQRRGWWQQIKSYFVDMLRKLSMPGIKLKEEITDNELRYLLWRSYKNLVEPNSYLKPLGYAEDVVKQKELKVGEYAEKAPATPMAADASEAEEWAAVTMQRIEELEAQATQLENEIAEMEADRDADDASRYEMWEQQLEPLRKQMEDVYAELEGLYNLEAEAEEMSMASEEGLRYRFIGEKGAENLDRAEEATTRLDNLKVAREMEAAEKDAKTIKMATGWERGADGKWRYETEDIEVDAKLMEEGEFDLTAILKANESSKELLLAYPQMNDYKVRYVYSAEGHQGLFDSSQKIIELNSRYLKTKKDIRSTLIHEIQHAIQQIEGFAAGAHWQDLMADELAERGFSFYDGYAYEENGHQILHELSLIRSHAENLVKNGKYKYLGSALKKTIEEYMSNNLIPDAFLDYFDSNIDSIINEARHATSEELDEMAYLLLHEENARNKYRLVSGEVEARNASRRMKMSLEKRRASLASKTEDVAREDQIFLYDAVESADEWYADELIARMKESAEALSPRLLTEEVWKNEIEGKTFQSPLGPVKLGNNQFEKNKGLGREREFGMIIPTIERPDLIIEEFDPKEGAERQTKYVFAKAFFDNKGNKHIYYANISVLKDGMEAVTSSHHLRPNQLRNKILKEHLLWNRFASDSTSSAQGGSTDQNNALSASKVNDNSSLVQEENVKSRDSEEIVAEVERESANLGVQVRIARSIDELPDEDTRKRAEDGKLKGYFDPRTGEVVVYEPNTNDANDAKRTILHEIVGHKGLRSLIGEQQYDKAMLQLMYMLPAGVRDAVLRRAERHGWNAAIAMDEYLAEQAERDVQPTWWGKVNAKIRALLRNLGFDVKLTDADVTYLLWRSRKKLQGDDLNDMAVNSILKQAARKSAEADAWNEQAFKDAEMRDFERNTLPSVRHRMGADVNDYEKAVRTLGFKQAEAWQDSMRSLLVFQQAIAKASGKDISDFENAYMYENRMSSANLMEMEQYRHMVYNPLLKEIHELEQMGASRESIINYLFAKSGLERNEVFARRDAKKHAEGDATKEQQLYDKYRQKDYAGLTALTRGDAQIAALVDDHSKKKTEYDRLEQNKKRGVAVSDADLKAAKKEMDDARKAMITAIEAEAQRMVDEFERAHNTDNLWDKIRNCTHTTLNISHDAGVMSDEVYNELWNQFQYYIPLRGFAETTAEDMYLYLGGNDSPYNAPIKTAYGRTSLADDPIATIGNMAESAIVEANRNRLKQRFLYMVERHNTDLASISDVWLEYDEVNDEWYTVFAQIPDDATPSEAKRLQQEFEDRMKTLAEQNPGKYANASQQPNIPYRVVKKGDRQEHHVIVKRNGKDVVITINGNPRVAQAINGLTNPEQNNGPVQRIVNWVNRNLSANFTMRNPAFMVSNFVRDGFYTNSMVWVKENPAYAKQYNKNWAICTAQIASLVSRYKRYEKGDTSALDMNNDMDRMFYEFMINGGETGYTVIKSVEDYKGLISGEMKKMEGGAMGTARRVADTIGNVVDTFGRWAEDTSRFAAYMTSRQLGRTITKSIWDAKEISVNFNKKGSGNRMMGKFEQGNRLNYVLSNMSQLGRNLYVFWNAGMQGLNNFKNAAKKSPAKFTAMAGTYFTLGVIVAAAFSGDDDEDDYYNLPEYVRRNNICFKIGKGKYATLPLPIEIRAIYGLGELAYSYLSGREGLTHGEAVTKTIQQITQVLPIDMMADGGGAMALVPSAAKPVVEVMRNVDWTGRPIYKEETSWNKNDPTWTLAFKSTSPELVGMSRLVNEWTNKNTADGLERPYNRGWADNRYLNNPAVWEHIMEGYLGGMATMFNQTKKTLMMPFNEDLREVRNVPIASRFIKDAGKEGRSYAARNEYYDAKNIMDSWKNEMSKAKKEVIDESLTDEQRLKAAKLRSSLEQQYTEAAERWKVLDRQRRALEEAYKNDQSEDNRQALDDVMMQMATLVEAYRD